MGCSSIGWGFLLYFLQHFFGDHLADVGNVCRTDKLQLDASHTGEPQLQLAVQIKGTCGFYGKCLDLAIGQGSEVFLFAGDTLDVDGDDSQIGKDNTVAKALVRGNDFLSAHQDGRDRLFKSIVIDGTELHKRSVIKINQGNLPFD